MGTISVFLIAAFVIGGDMVNLQGYTQSGDQQAGAVDARRMTDLIVTKMDMDDDGDYLHYFIKNTGTVTVTTDFRNEIYLDGIYKM
ncbi:MAG: hypothetical protein ACD_28C00379G0005 [uncultured bacterium]|nr:MAG: hypothetical protein ACD_28C00379G0005 [uncultured bacterium]KKT74018.1 MAG: hypothetical protein UW70_C0069G0012 [Candidatus Peregrinibacteria bacterium GW2011_GWA2_44_7]